MGEERGGRRRGGVGEVRGWGVGGRGRADGAGGGRGGGRGGGVVGMAGSYN